MLVVQRLLQLQLAKLSIGEVETPHIASIAAGLNGPYHAMRTHSHRTSSAPKQDYGYGRSNMSLVMRHKYAHCTKA